MQIRELTHRNREGVPYRREPAVECQIGEALLLDPPRMLERARLRDYRQPSYLQEECLVYLIRDYRLRGEAATVGTLCEALLGRCARHIHGRLSALAPDARDDAYSEVVVALFDRILNLDSDAGDFLQVRFWVVLDTLAVTAFGRQVRELRRAKTRQAPLSALPGYAEDEGDRAVAVRAADLPAQPGMDQALLSQEGLRALAEPYRTVFVLRHYEGWPIEDKDPSVPTISRHFQRTPRTIRNWMREAENVLAAWRGGYP